jgi:hypothetical protein
MIKFLVLLSCLVLIACNTDIVHDHINKSILINKRMLQSIGPKKLAGVKWMHIPKASSWLGDFLLLYACPHLRPHYDSMQGRVFFYDNINADPTLLNDCEVEIVKQVKEYGWHDPYMPSIANGTTVALFREPSDRIVSSFLFGTNGMMIPTGNIYSRNNTLPAYVAQSPFPVVSYASLPGFTGCQTKMVLGYACGDSKVQISPDMLQEAKRRVAIDFAFVGKLLVLLTITSFKTFT